MSAQDNRPRFGWSGGSDDDPTIVWEEKDSRVPPERPVAVIPLPYISEKVRAKVRAFVDGTLFPKNRKTKKNGRA
jgi:hypothetical protein